MILFDIGRHRSAFELRWNLILAVLLVLYLGAVFAMKRRYKAPIAIAVPMILLIFNYALLGRLTGPTTDLGYEMIIFALGAASVITLITGPRWNDLGQEGSS